MIIKKSESETEIVYTAYLGTAPVGWLSVDKITRVILGVEVSYSYRHRGYAREMYQRALMDGPVLHAHDDMMTPEGKAWFRRVGGEQYTGTEYGSIYLPDTPDFD